MLVMKRWIVVSWLWLLLLGGCGSDSASVSGQIKLNGQPMIAGEGVFGSVVFYREDGSGVPASGTIDDSGRYELATGGSAGLAPGGYLVGVTVRQSLPRKQDELPQSKLLSPAKYADPKQSGLRAEVVQGSNEFDFDLTGTPAA
jgi:hypothetical protein